MRTYIIQENICNNVHGIEQRDNTEAVSVVRYGESIIPLTKSTVYLGRE